MQIVLQQYEYVKSARGALLQYCAAIPIEQLQQGHDTFNGSSIIKLLVHSANTYQYWLKHVGLQQESAYPHTGMMMNITDIKALYETTNIIVQDFIGHFSEKWMESFTARQPNRELQLTPWQLFTHVITHEFHHKGQILTMSRLLGYIPADTDVIRF